MNCIFSLIPPFFFQFSFFIFPCEENIIYADIFGGWGLFDVVASGELEKKTPENNGMVHPPRE